MTLAFDGQGNANHKRSLQMEKHDFATFLDKQSKSSIRVDCKKKMHRMEAWQMKLSDSKIT
jgi:hypothetical protein